MKQGKTFLRLLQSVITPVLFLLGSQYVHAQFPGSGDCPAVVTTCATPVVTAVDPVSPICPESENYDLRVEFLAGGTTTDPNAFSSHYWVIQLVTKDSCVYRTDPVTIGTTTGPTYVMTSGSSLIFDVSPEDLNYITGGSGCSTTSAPLSFGGLDSVFVSVVQRCDDPDEGCSNYSAALGDALPPGFNLFVAQSSLDSPLDSNYYGYCSTNDIIYIDPLSSETEELGLTWYTDSEPITQSVKICIQDWAPIAVVENYDLVLNYSGSSFDQSVADGWNTADPGDSIVVSTEVINGQVCYKLTYHLDGDGVLDPAMNNKIVASATAKTCEQIMNVTIDTASTTVRSFKMGWATNMLTTNHKFKIRIYQGGICDNTMATTDTAATRPNTDNTFIHELIVNSNNTYLTKFSVYDTIGTDIIISDSFSLDLGVIGLSLQNCTCFQAFVHQICDGVDFGPPAPSWSTGAQTTTDCMSCDDGVQNQGETGIDCGGPCPACASCIDGIQNQGETGIDCGGPCSACPESTTCETPAGVYADNITGNQARLNWTAEPNADLYQVRIKLLSSATWSTLNSVASSLTITNLSVGAVYEWQVRTYCGTSYSDWSISCTLVGGDGTSSSCLRSGIQPTCSDGIQNQGETGIDCGGPCTPCAEGTACEAPLTIYANNITANKVTLNWSAVAGATGYDVQIRLISNDSWYTFTSTQTRLELSGIVPGQVYEWKVRTNCISTTTAWSTTCSFTGNSGTTSTCTGVVPEGDSPTCTDGIQNGDETGIDCGGTSCSPCPEVTACEVPAGMYANSIETDRATLNWTAVPGANSYQIQIKLASAVSWYTFTTNSADISIRGLGNGIEYEWHVRTYCGTEYSDWSDICTFVAGDITSSSCVSSTATPTCYDGIQNQGETGIDCGGPCTACATCTDGIQNGDETGIDCGGNSCAPCPEVSGCEVPVGLYASLIETDRATLNWNPVTDATGYQMQIKLASAVSWYTFTTTTNAISIRGLGNGIVYEWRVRTYCGTEYSDWSTSCTFVAGDATSSSCLNTESVQPTCSDGIQNQGETGIDCGGPCRACATCFDGIQNQDETGVDCGGVCSACPTAESCEVPSGLYVSSITRSSARLNWTAVSGAITYVVQIKLSGSTAWYSFSTGSSYLTIRGLSNGFDYDWRVYTQCDIGSSDWAEACTFIAGVATSGQCISGTNPEGGVATCDDGVQNGDETGVDCGGSCAACPTCFDGIQNGDETGVDCGGSCGVCPTCNDGIQNGDETGVDCGGSCGPCPETTGCSAPDGLYADDIDRTSVRLNWNAIPTSLRYYLRFRQLGSSTWINYNTSISTVGLRGVLLGVTYEWEIRALCNDGTYTDWSKTCTFIGGDATSGSCDTASKTASSTTQGIQAFPNPASGVLNVDVSYPSEENLVLSIRDLRGLELIRRNLNSGTETLTLDISGLNPGVYLVVVSNSRIRTVQRVVVQ
jgi:hypothetical protein